MSKAELTAKQQRFVEEYMKDLNATQAAIRAGYSKRSAAVQGVQLLRKSQVSAYVDQLRAAQTERTGSDADRIKAALRAIAFSDQRKYQKWGPTGVNILESDGLSDDEAAAVAEVAQTITGAGAGSFRIKQHDKIRALELLAKMEGMLKDRVEVEDMSSWKAELANMTTEQIEARSVSLLIGKREEDLAKMTDEQLGAAAAKVVLERMHRREPQNP